MAAFRKDFSQKDHRSVRQFCNLQVPSLFHTFKWEIMGVAAAADAGSWPEALPLEALGIFCLVHLPSGNYSHSFYASSWEELLFSDSLPIRVLGTIEIQRTRWYLGSRQAEAIHPPVHRGFRGRDCQRLATLRLPLPFSDFGATGPR